MGKVFAQHTGSAWDFSGSIAKAASANSGAFYTQGYSRLVGAIYSSGSLTSGSGLQILQSIDGGSNWDISNTYAPSTTGASLYDIEVVGNKMFISASPGADNITNFRALFYLQPIGLGTVGLKVGSIDIGNVVVDEISKIQQQVSASVSGGSVALKAGVNDVGIVHVGTGACSFGSASLSSAIPAGEAHIGEIGGKTVIVSACVTRPDDVVSYITGDMWASASTNASLLRFPNCARKDNGSGIISQVLCINSASLATQPQINLWLFDNTVTSPSDNAPFALTDASIETTVGVVELSTWFAGGSTLNSLSQVRGVNIPFVCQSACNSLWGIPVIMNSCSPVALQNLQFRLGIFDD